MWWLPFKTLEIKTEQNIAKVRSILRWNIAGGYSLSRPTFGIDTQKRFWGYMREDDTFRIRPVIRYRNSFLPVICGEIRTRGNGTLIRVRMRPPIVSAAFMLTWYSLLGIALVAVIRSGSFSGVAVALLMAVVGFGIMTGAFGYEAGKSKKYLEKLFRTLDGRE